MEQPTTPTPEQLADSVVKEWRRRHLLYPTRQTAGSLAQMARDMTLLPTHVPLLVTAEEFKTMWGGDLTHAQQCMFSFGYTIRVDPRAQQVAPAQSAGTTRPEFIEGVLEDIKINLASGGTWGGLLAAVSTSPERLTAKAAIVHAFARHHWEIWRCNHPHATVFQSLRELIAIYKRFNADDKPIILAADTYKEVVRAVSAHEGRSMFWERTATLCEGFIYAQRHFIREGSDEPKVRPPETAAKPDTVGPHPIPIMHSVEMQPLPLPTELKTAVGASVPMWSVSDRTFDQLLERFTTAMRDLRAKGKL